MSRLQKFINALTSLPRVAGNMSKKYPTTKNLESFLHDHRQIMLPGFDSSLDLGCGPSPRNPFQAKTSRGIDIRRWPGSDNVLQADLSRDKLPFDDNQLDCCTAFDFIEHVPRILPTSDATRFPFVELMDEIHRTLKPGGLFLHQTPAFPSKESFQDPTHVNIITEDTFPNYFCRAAHEQQPLAHLYGFKGEFKLIAQRWAGPWLIGLLSCCKS